jgi:hypothetical protein
MHQKQGDGVQQKWHRDIVELFSGTLDALQTVHMVYDAFIIN